MPSERLYTPWRMNYILSDKKREGCVFCRVLADDEARNRENFVLYRAEETFVIMNVYPYNVGHLMVLPRDHVSDLFDVSQTAQIEMITLISYFTRLLSAVLKPDGFNIGINLGKAAGAGIGDHLHTHIVPRWNGDSNFMPVIGQTRLLPEELGDTYDKIVAALQETPPSL